MAERSCISTPIAPAPNSHRHTVTVEAKSVYEACVLALKALKKAGFVDLQPGPASTLQVQVLEPSVTHHVNVGQVQRWLELASSNPNEEAKRKRRRELVA
jgi:hypothetical protein